MLRLDGLGRRFGDFWAVRDVSLEVAPGEVLGLLGPNGAGKTTTIRLLAALIAPSEGHAWVDGLDVREEPDEIRRRIGILTETPGLYDKLSAERNLDYFGRLYRLPTAVRAERIERWMRLLGIWDRRAEAGRDVQQGHAPEARDRPGAAPRAARAVPRRAHRRARPGGRVHRPRGDRRP